VQTLTSKLPSYLPLILLCGALVVALFMARRLWEETHEDDEPVTEGELLDEFEKAHAAGELDEAELRRVRALLNRPKVTGSDPGRPRPDLKLASASESPASDDPGEDESSADDARETPESL